MCICPEYRPLLNGVEKADSFDMNLHKWFLTNFDCSCLWVKDRSPLLAALTTNPEYLRNKQSEANAVVDFKDWQIPLSRRFRYDVEQSQGRDVGDRRAGLGAG